MQSPEVLGGRYELRGILGRGGMAEVRDGWDRRLGRAVAVKLMHPMISAEPENRRRFDTEARAAAGLNHPHIVAIHDSGEHNGSPYIVMERLAGRTLADALAYGPLPPHQVRSILDNVLSALATAHAAGVLHRDIKPANILFTDRGDVKVADFGIAKSADSAQTVTGRIFGTMAYLSADRIAGRPANASDDLYALGVVGYEALTGRRLFPQNNLVELAHAIAEQQPPPVAMLRPDVDPALASAIDRAMARDPQWRFPDAQAMQAALAGAAPVVAVRPPTRVLAEPLPAGATMAVAAPVAPRRYLGLLGIAAVVVAVLLALLLMVLDSGAAPPTPQPASTSTPVTTPPSTPTLPSSTSMPPPTTYTPPAQVDQGPRRGEGNNGNNGNGNNGNGNGKKPKDRDDD